LKKGYIDARNSKNQAIDRAEQCWENSFSKSTVNKKCRKFDFQKILCREKKQEAKEEMAQSKKHR
jgi:hypothetical protein